MSIPISSSRGSQKPIITTIGDSTIDNKVWIKPGIFLNYFYGLLGIKRSDTQTRIKQSHRPILKTELTVVENLIDMLPGHEVCDYTNDGFTTSDCLHGAYKNKAFGGPFANYFPSIYPSQLFNPLNEGAQSISESQHIILSIGGNDFREFLQAVLAQTNDKRRRKYIVQHYEQVFENLKNNYINIIKKIRELNPSAKIILMTQYYPSATQNNYKIYPFMTQIGRALDIGINPNNPMDVICEIMKKTYSDILKSEEIDNGISNIVVADITSSLNLFDSNNYKYQIEPSGIGGKKIAQMLKYIVEDDHSPSGQVYQFKPEFFLNPEKPDLLNESQNVEKILVSRWTPKHPNELNGKACYHSGKALQLLLDNSNDLTNEEKIKISSTVQKNINLQQSLIALQQVSKNLVNLDNYNKIITYPNLQNALAAAHSYLNSGRFGFFRTHGNHGKKETEKFVGILMQIEPNNNDEIRKAIFSWLKTSNTNNSSRAYYACKYCFVDFKYATATKEERKNWLKKIFNIGNTEKLNLTDNYGTFEA